MSLLRHRRRMMKSHSDPWSQSPLRSPEFQLERHFIAAQNHEHRHLLRLGITQPGLTLAQSLAAAPTAYQPLKTLGFLPQALVKTAAAVITILLTQQEATNHIHVSQQLHNYRDLLPDLVIAKFPEFGATAPLNHLTTLLIPSTLAFSDLFSILLVYCSDHDSVFTRSIAAHLSKILLSWHKYSSSFALFEDLQVEWKYSNGSWPLERL